MNKRSKENKTSKTTIYCRCPLKGSLCSVQQRLSVYTRFLLLDGRIVRYLSVILYWGASWVHLRVLRLPNPVWHHSPVELYYTNASFTQVWRFIIRSAIRWERSLLAVYRPWVRVLEVGRTKIRAFVMQPREKRRNSKLPEGLTELLNNSPYC